MELAHLDKNGNAIMVDVSEKEVTHRTASACGTILVDEEILEALRQAIYAKPQGHIFEISPANFPMSAIGG